MTLPSDDLAPSAADGLWHAAAGRVLTWAAERRLALRDVVVLLPFAQLLPVAREAFASLGVWMPRIETTRTLAASLAPPPQVPPGGLRFDAALDELAAQRRVSERRSQLAPGIDSAALASDVAALAQGFAQAAAAVAPPARSAWFAARRDLLAPHRGPGADERLLARIALDWAAEGEAATDALWALQPAAWVIVRAGGAQPLADALAGSGERPVLTIDLDAEEPDGISGAHPALVACAAFEDEAQAAAAEVVASIAEGQAPVALITEDRALARRIRALLERRGAAIADETGWRLSTTRSAARLGAWLDAAAPEANADALVDALKALAEWRAEPAWSRAVDRIEAQCRRRRWTRFDRVDPQDLDAEAAAAWRDVMQWSAPLRLPAGAAHRPLAQWLDAVAVSLLAAGAWDRLAADPAGRAVIDALGLDAQRPRGQALRAEPGALDASGFRRWLDRTLDAASYVPAAPAAPDVVLLPLARALLRPFPTVVFPGLDDRQFGLPGAPWPLVGDRLAGELGLATAAQRDAALDAALGHLLRVPRLVLLHRMRHEGEPVGPSRWIERLDERLRAAGGGIVARADRRIGIRQPSAPVRRSEPTLQRMPPIDQLSATAAESLRDCPYRFFALHRLRLAEDRELEPVVEPQDFGNWAHAVLHRFHLERHAPASAVEEVDRLLAIAAEVRRERGLEASAFLPYDADFRALARRYVEWLHERDAEGWHWHAGEVERLVQPEALGGIRLRGVIDRIDRRGPDLELIDYKTGSLDALKSKVRNPFEDTQLAFYAALVAPEAKAGVTARYLAIGKTRAFDDVEHRQPLRSAQALLQGLGDELARVAAGAPLAPLGEGPACEFCAARGLCRRDHWSAAS
jgi:ATP-dependent helicase/nuclease subunit B